MDALSELASDWTPPIFITAGCVLSLIVYFRGYILLRRSRPSLTPMRALSFCSGIVILWVALGSPLEELADRMLTAHMIEHLLLMSAIPMLLLYGLPGVPLLRGLPRPMLKFVVGPLVRITALRRVGEWLVTPAVAWLGMNVAYLCWHVPAAYNLALENETVHGVEHLCFLLTSLLFWWYILRPWPAKERPDDWGMLVYLAMGDVVMTLLSAFLAFCERPVYSYYVLHPNPFGISVMDDQVLGAVVMWVLGSFAYLVPAMVITFRLAGMSGRRPLPVLRRAER